MNTKRFLNKSTLLFSSISLFFTQLLFAGAGDFINNIADVNYQVNSVTQTVVESSPTGNSVAGIGEGTNTVVTEDQLINFAVYTIDTADQAATPGATQDGTTHWTNYTVYNISATDTVSAPGAPAASLFSNGTITVALTAANITAEDSPHSGSNDFDTTNCTVYNAGGTGTITDVLLGPGETADIRVSCDIPVTATNTLVSSAVELRGEVTLDFNGDAVGADNSVANTIDGVEHVFVDDAKHLDTTGGAAGDGVNNKISIDYSAFVIESAELVVTKTATVVNDPVNGDSNPKAIPGSILEYVISVENTGSATASVVEITDTLPATIQCVNTDANPGATHAAAATVLPAAGNSATDCDGTQNAQASCATIAPTETCSLTFFVEVQ